MALEFTPVDRRSDVNHDTVPVDEETPFRAAESNPLSVFVGGAVRIDRDTEPGRRLLVRASVRYRLPYEELPESPFDAEGEPVPLYTDNAVRLLGNVVYVGPRTESPEDGLFCAADVEAFFTLGSDDLNPPRLEGVNQYYLQTRFEYYPIPGDLNEAGTAVEMPYISGDWGRWRDLVAQRDVGAYHYPILGGPGVGVASRTDPTLSVGAERAPIRPVVKVFNGTGYYTDTGDVEYIWRDRGRDLYLNLTCSMWVWIPEQPEPAFLWFMSPSRPRDQNLFRIRFPDRPALVTVEEQSSVSYSGRLTFLTAELDPDYYTMPI